MARGQTPAHCPFSQRSSKLRLRQKGLRGEGSQTQQLLKSEAGKYAKHCENSEEQT